ncbi:MAG: hypothetical protein F6J98_01960 [Moorea sp. SIO4G2]|nr:hypothetical protein [Moorena sp. SIO4G2]
MVDPRYASISVPKEQFRDYQEGIPGFAEMSKAEATMTAMSIVYNSSRSTMSPEALVLVICNNAIEDLMEIRSKVDAMIEAKKVSRNEKIFEQIEDLVGSIDQRSLTESEEEVLRLVQNRQKKASPLD